MVENGMTDGFKNGCRGPASMSKTGRRVGPPLLFVLAVVGALFLVAACSDHPNALSQTQAVFLLQQPDSQETYFDLPWPNDVRRHDDGTLDLTLFPSHTAMTDDYIKLFDGAIHGFSTQGAIYFRFTGPVDASSLPSAAADTLEAGSGCFLVSVDADSPDYGERVPVDVDDSLDRSYVGTNTLALLPHPGFVLRPQTTYAAIVTDAILGEDGKPVRPGQDLKVVLASSDPGGSDVRHRAWQAYAPLRQYLADQDIATSHVVSAALFTTQDPVSLMGKLREAVYRDMPDAPDPTAFSHRSSYDHFDLYEGTYDSPNYQQGDPPYLHSGGQIDLDQDGMPKLVRTESLRFALSVPKGTMPAAGWPVVLYAHGTGGDYMTFVRAGVADNLAAVKDGASVVAGFAVVGIDQVLHGTRCGGQQCDSETMFFNYQNPAAGLDNVRQAACDDFQLIRLVEAFAVASAPGTGTPIRFDPHNIFFMGHSQGGITGPPFLAFEPDVKAAVLSGAGGNMILSLTEKTEPYDIPALVALMLDEETIDRFHPALTLIQTYTDPSDPTNYARLITAEPPFDYQVKSVFQSQGYVDHYVPPDLLEALGVSLGLTWTGPEVQPLVGFALAGQSKATARPVSGNLADGAATGVFVQYNAQDGDDGHFVVFDVASAMRDYRLFLTSALEGVPVLK